MKKKHSFSSVQFSFALACHVFLSYVCVYKDMLYVCMCIHYFITICHMSQNKTERARGDAGASATAMSELGGEHNLVLSDCFC